MFFLFWFFHEGLQFCWGSNIKFLLYANFSIILKRCLFLPAFRIQHDCRLLYRAQGPNSVSPRILITAHREQCMEDKPVTSSVSSEGTQCIVRGNTVYRQREHSVSSGGTRGIVRGNSVSSEGTPGIRLEPHVMPPHGIPKARIASVPWQDVGLFSTSWANTLPAASTFLEPHHLEQSSSPLSEMPSKQSFTPSKCSKWLLTWTGEGGSLISLAFSHLSLCCNSCRQEG